MCFRSEYICSKGKKYLWRNTNTGKPGETSGHDVDIDIDIVANCIEFEGRFLTSACATLNQTSSWVIGSSAGLSGLIFYTSDEHSSLPPALPSQWKRGSNGNGTDGLPGIQILIS